MRKIRYYKPDMTNLHGKLGRSIIRTLKTAQAPDLTKQKHMVKALNEQIKAAKDAGVY